MNNVNVGQKISCTETLQLIIKQRGEDTEGGVAIPDQLSPRACGLSL